MDAYSFVNNIAATLKFAPNPPGNANPSVAIPNPLNPTVKQVVGPNPSDLAWSGWLNTAKNVFTAPARLVEGSWTAFSQADDKATGMVKTAIDTSVSAATGLFGGLKWIVAGLIAFAVIYLLILIAPFLGGLSGAIKGNK